MGVQILTGPATEPVSLNEAKLHLRVDITEDDALITRLIVGAREWAEKYTRRSLITQDLRLSLDSFPIDGGAIEIPRGPVQSSPVLVVAFTNVNGISENLEGCQLDNSSLDELHRLLPPVGESWPSTRDQVNAVLIDYRAGYGDAEDVPADIRTAILLHVGWHYENREAKPFGAASGGSFEVHRQALEQKLADYRLFTFV